MISLYIDVFLLSLPIGSQGEILRAELVSLADINVHSELWAALSSYEWLSAISSETPWRFFRVPWTARKAYQSILKEISPEYSLERLMLKLKLQYLGCLMWKPDSFEKTLMLGKIEGGRRWGRQRIFRTADFDCSHEIKRPLLLGRKVMTNLDSILKSRDITFPTKVHLVKALVFPVVMYGCESWTIRKAEHRRIDAFELWCWRRLLRVPWTARRSNQSNSEGNQSWIFIGRTDAETESAILWPPDAKNWLIGKDPDARKDWGQEEKRMIEDEIVRWHHRFNGHEFE